MMRAVDAINRHAFSTRISRDRQPLGSAATWQDQQEQPRGRIRQDQPRGRVSNHVDQQDKQDEQPPGCRLENAYNTCKHACHLRAVARRGEAARGAGRPRT